jgi:flagellar motility protein MotE (MotC chaperone)
MNRKNLRPIGLAAAAMLLLAGTVTLHAQQASEGKAATEVPASAPGLPANEAEPAVAPADEDNASQYCRNIANAAADARYLRQSDALAAMEKQLDERIAKLEAKRAEYEEWVKRREEFLAKADGAVVAIYSQMRPDAAAQQISVMEPEAAAAILSKLTPRTASAILNEMDATIAAELTNVMAGLPPREGGST